MSTSMGHDLTLRDVEQQSHDRIAPSPPELYEARVERLMASAGANVWLALMQQNAERAKRKDVAA